MNDKPIVIEDLVKYYDGRCVLDGVSLEVPRGCIYGLLGRNGSGKTTMIRILLGLEPPTRGRTLVLGEDSMKLSANTHGRIGYVAEGHHLIQSYKVRRLVGLCKGLSLRWNDEFFGQLMETFRLPMDRKVKDLSTGMRAQLNLALAMAIDPELVILDDPTLGLDTVARRQFLELAIDVIQRQGRTILFSSHILSDVERIADRIGVLVAGKLVVDCSLDELKSRVKKAASDLPRADAGGPVPHRHHQPAGSGPRNGPDRRQLEPAETGHPGNVRPGKLHRDADDARRHLHRMHPARVGRRAAGKRGVTMLSLIVREIRDHNVYFGVCCVLSAFMVVAIVLMAVYGIAGQGIAAVCMCSGLLFTVLGVLGVAQMYGDRANRVSTLLSTQAVTRARILVARILAGVLILLISLIPVLVASVVLLKLQFPPLEFYSRMVWDISVVLAPDGIGLPRRGAADRAGRAAKPG